MAKQPTRASLIARIEELESRTLPLTLDTLVDGRNEPESTLSTLTADRVHAAITNAETGNTRDLFAIYRDVLVSDTHLQSIIETRFLSVIGDDPVISPVNPDSGADVEAAEAIKAAVDRLPDFLGMCSDLLWGTIWPLALVERTYRTMNAPGLKYDWGEIGAVPDYLFRWTEGRLELEAIEGASRKPCGTFYRPDPARYITHKAHFLVSKMPDNWGGPMRALMWWYLLKVMDREWWVRFLDRFGTPFPVAKFPKADDRSRQILERAFKLSSRIGGLVVSQGTQVELIQASTAAGDAHEKFFQRCNDEMSRRVLGQTLSSTASPTGLGSGASGIQGQVRSDITAHDKKRLAQTLRQQFFRPWLRINGFTGSPPFIVFGGEEPEENSTTAEVLAKLKSAGLRISDKSLAPLSKRIGLEIERDPSSVPASVPGATKTLSVLPGHKDPVKASLMISREAAAELQRVYRGTLAPVREIILASTSPDDCQARLLSAFTDWDATKAAEVVETALTAGAWNGLDA